MSPVTRTYTGRLLGVDPTLLWTHHEAICRAKGIVSEIFTVLRAGVGPELIAPDLGQVGLQRQLVASLWFPVEDTVPSDGRLVVSTAEVIEQFRDELIMYRLDQHQVDSWLRDVGPVLTMKARNGAVHVNRRAQLRRWCSEWGVAEIDAFNDVVELTLGRSWTAIVAHMEKVNKSDPVDGYAGKAPDFIPALGVPDLKFPVGAWVSKRFGTGSKSDRAGKARAAHAVASIIVPDSAITAGELVDSVAAVLGVSPVTAAILDRVHRGNGHGKAGGARSRLYRRLLELSARTSAVEPDDVRALIAEAEREAAKQGGATANATTSWSEVLRERVTDDVGLVLSGRSRVWREIINGGVRNLVGHTSWTVRQLLCRHALDAERSRLQGKLGREVVNLFDGWFRQRDEQAVANGSTSGKLRIVKNVFAEFADCSDPDTRRKAVERMESHWDRGAGDPAFFEWLAEDGSEIWRGVSANTATTRLHNYTELVTARRRWEGLHLPQLSHPDPTHAPQWSTFDCGTSNYLPYKMQKDTSDRAAVDATGFRVRLALWDGNGWRDTAARITSTYFVEQVRAQQDALARHGVTVSANEGTPVARVDAISRRVSVRTEDVLRVAERTSEATPTLQLKFDRTRHRHSGQRGIPGQWSVALATKLEPTSPTGDGTPSRAPKRGQAALGHRVLGIDLGLRTLAGWAVWEVVDEGEVGNVAASSGIGLTDAARHLASPTPDEPGPLGDHRLVYRKLDGHEQGHWARLEATGLLDLADGRKSSGNGVEPGPKRTAPQPTRRDWMLAARALKHVGARLNTPQHVTDDYRTSNLAFDYLHSVKRAIVRHGQLAGLAVAVEQGTDAERLLRLISGWWKAAAREPRSYLARLWRSHVLPELPRESVGELVEWRGAYRDQRPNLPQPAVADLRDYVERLLTDTELREHLVAWMHAVWADEDQRLRVPLRLTRVVLSGGVVPAKLATTIGMPAASNNAQDGDYEHPGAVIGLSPRRLQLLDELYKVKRSWHMRRRPHRPADGDIEVEQQPDGTFTAVRGQDLLARLTDKRDRVRDQLSKQVASAIVETAAANRCHSIAYENLDAYRTSLHRSRDENAKLRRWPHQSLTKHLEEIATLHGFGYRAINPRGSSQYSAVTDERGVRVEKVPAHRFAQEVPTWWASAVKAARTRTRRSEDRPIDQAVLATEPLLDKLPEQGFVLIPRPGGEYFAAEWPPDQGVRVLDNAAVPLPSADVNAAANIALRSLCITKSRRTA